MKFTGNSTLARVLAGLVIGCSLAALFLLYSPDSEESEPVAPPRSELEGIATAGIELAPGDQLRTPMAARPEASPGIEDPSAGSESPSAAAGALAPEPQEETPASWEAYYSAYPRDLLDAESDRLSRTIQELTTAELQKRFEQGFGEFISSAQQLDLNTAWDNSVIMNVIIASNGQEAYRVVLPRDEFPEAYLLHDKKTWLDKERAKRRQ